MVNDMKKKIAKYLIYPQPIWWLVDRILGGISRFYHRLRKARIRQMLFSEITVLSGHFRGMRYPDVESVGSAIYPKLLGTYENELSSVISRILRKPYCAIVDVGCAEGFYAVGLGMHHRSASVYAYDTDERAISLCREMADLNGVKVHLGGFCDQSTLLELDLGERALIFADCEGYENELFDSDLINRLKRHDFLIETHDFIRRGTTEKLMNLFQNTHSCELIHSISDYQKVLDYDLSLLASYRFAERKSLLAEYRPEIMSWIFAESKRNDVGQDT